MAVELSVRAVQLSGGRTLWFGDACLATGSHIRRLRLDGGGLGGVHYLRTLRNSASIRADAENAEHVVLVGGSYISTEVAATLAAAGHRCALVMQEDLCLDRPCGTD